MPAPTTVGGSPLGLATDLPHLGEKYQVDYIWE